MRGPSASLRQAEHPAPWRSRLEVRPQTTVSGITVVSSTSVTATFAIPAGATLNARTVSVTTPGGTSGTVAFTVGGASPNHGQRHYRGEFHFGHGDLRNPGWRHAQCEDRQRHYARRNIRYRSVHGWRCVPKPRSAALPW